MTPAPEAVQSFVLRYFRLLGARIEEVQPGLFRIEIDRGLAGELERDTMPAWMWVSGPNPPAHVTYYFAFSPEVAERHTDAELVSPGSHRLQQVIESVRDIAKGTRAHLPLPWHAARHAPGAEIRYRPFYVFCLRAEFHGARPFSRLFCVAVDLVDLLPLRQLGELFPRLHLAPGRPDEADVPSTALISPAPSVRNGEVSLGPREPGGPRAALIAAARSIRPGGVPVETARADLETAFAIAYRELLDALATADARWAEETLASVEQERRRLTAYFADCERDGLDVSEEREHRLAELEQMSPRVFVRLQGVCEAYLPVRYAEGSVEHLALSPAGLTRSELFPLRRP